MGGDAPLVTLRLGPLLFWMPRTGMRGGTLVALAIKSHRHCRVNCLCTVDTMKIIFALVAFLASAVFAIAQPPAGELQELREQGSKGQVTEQVHLDGSSDQCQCF